MKKIFSIVAILFCFATSYGQETKPTKQETMDWIGKTLVKYSNEGDYNNVYLSDFKYSNGIVKFKESYPLIYYKNTNCTEECIIYLNRIMNSDQFVITGTSLVAIKKNCTNNPKEIESRRTSSISLNVYFQFIDENNILERFNKALKNLIEYNKKDLPKEAY